MWVRVCVGVGNSVLCCDKRGQEKKKKWRNEKMMTSFYIHIASCVANATFCNVHNSGTIQIFLQTVPFQCHMLTIWYPLTSQWDVFVRLWPIRLRWLLSSPLSLAYLREHTKKQSLWHWIGQRGSVPLPFLLSLRHSLPLSLSPILTLPPSTLTLFPSSSSSSHYSLAHPPLPQYLLPVLPILNSCLYRHPLAFPSSTVLSADRQRQQPPPGLAVGLSLPSFSSLRFILPPLPFHPLLLFFYFLPSFLPTRRSNTHPSTNTKSN